MNALIETAVKLEDEAKRLRSLASGVVLPEIGASLNEHIASLAAALPMGFCIELNLWKHEHDTDVRPNWRVYDVQRKIAADSHQLHLAVAAAIARAAPATTDPLADALATLATAEEPFPF